MKLTYIILTILLSIQAYCLEGETNKKPKFGGTYQRILTNLPETFDPAFVTDSDSSEVIAQLYSRLFRMGQDLSASPDIVKSWEISEDQKTYTFYLREKIRFHTVLGDSFNTNSYTTKNRGRELKAQDVKFSLERVLNPKTNSPHKSTLLSGVVGVKEFQNHLATQVSGIKVLDEHILEIQLVAPSPSFLMELSSHALSIVAQEDIIANKNQLHANPVGTGPFILQSFDPKKDLIIRANLDYFKGRPYLDAIRFQFRRENNLNEFSLFQEKKLHHINSIPRKELKESIKSSEYSFFEKPSLQIQYLAFNVNQKPFDDVRVRQAFNYAINKDVIVKYVLNNRGFTANSPLPPGILGHMKDYNPYEFNPKKAKRLLLDCGFSFDEKGLVSDFPEVKLYVTGRKGSTNRIGRMVQSNLLDIGIEIQLVLQNWSNHFGSISKAEASFFTMGWILDYADADNVLRYNFTCNNIDNDNNSSRYCNPKVDKLIESARFTNNSKIRNEYYDQAQKLLMKDSPWICLYFPTTYILAHQFVQGIQLSSFGESEFNYHNIWLDLDKNIKK
ncbi:MAG: hypothetical protein KC646_14110 [Candidatus Cloacimonetes bacterium]|nr:hypothetical protein [Candidatus Cloacimonadota bacterium]